MDILLFLHHHINIVFVSFLVAMKRQQSNSCESSTCDSFSTQKSSDPQIKTLCMDHNTRNVGYIFEPTLLFVLRMSQMLVSTHTHAQFWYDVRSLHITGGKWWHSASPAGVVSAQCEGTPGDERVAMLQLPQGRLVARWLQHSLACIDLCLPSFGSPSLTFCADTGEPSAFFFFPSHSEESPNTRSRHAVAPASWIFNL